MGYFQQLEQLMGVVYDRENINEMIELFNCKEVEEREVNLLSGLGNHYSLIDKLGFYATCL